MVHALRVIVPATAGEQQPSGGDGAHERETGVERAMAVERAMMERPTRDMRECGHVDLPLFAKC
ncbi:hypothetical protein GCM10009548_56970 [Streptomyces malaysiensis subsp. malaysiensis]